MSLPPLVLKFCVHIITIIILLFLNQRFQIKYEEEVIYMTIRFLKPSHAPHFEALSPQVPISNVLIIDLLPSLSSWTEAQTSRTRRLSVSRPTQNTCT